MTDPGRYDRPDPCDDCGQPHRGDCPEPWDDDEELIPVRFRPITEAEEAEDIW